ncbi:MAG: phage tail tape measure protein, partial [Pseudomonadota bacterium]
AARFVSGLSQAEGGVRRFGQTAKREFDALKGALGSIQGQLATLGLTTGAVASLMQSARMDKGLVQIGQTAGMTRTEVAELRRELFRMAGDTGQQVDDLQLGFNNAVQAGLKFREALPVIDATNMAMAVTGASADRLTASLSVAGTAYQFDLAKPGMAISLLDKMTVAGRQGNAELQNLSDIFGRVGVNAASAGLSFDKTLGFIEALSLVERSPERLATLADSTLRLFTNLNYMKEAAQATNVRFFEKDGARRDPVAVLRDVKKEYDKLTTDKDRALFMQKAFGKADLDTIKGLKTLLGGDMLGKVDEFAKAIGDAGGTIEKNLPEAISNAVDQTGRLKAELRKAADDFAKPINDALAKTIQWGMDKKENGGLGLSGKEMIGGGAALALGTLAAARYGGMALGGLAKRFGGTAAGVAEGKALETAAGVTPVFVVNWPASMGGASVVGEIAATAAGGAAGAGTAGKVASRAKSLAVLAGGLPLSAWGSMGAAGLATAGAGVMAAGAGGYAVGTGINKAFIEGTAVGDKIGEGVARVLAFFGNEEARRAVEINDKLRDAKIGGEVRIRIDQDGRVSSMSARSDNRDVPLSVDGGMMMVAP